MRKPRVIGGTCSLLIVALATAACGSTTSGSSGTQVVIGTTGPLTGSGASFGVDSQDAYELAVSQQNASGGLFGHPVKLINLDSKGDPSVAAIDAQTLIDDHVAGVVGDTYSTACLAQAPIFHRVNMPWVIAVCSNDALTNPPENGWRNQVRAVYRDDSEGKFAGTYAYQNLDAKTAVVINDGTAYSQSSGASFVQSFTAAGGQVLSVLQITAGQTDYTPIMEKAKSENPDLIHFTGFPPEGGLLALEAKQLHVTAKLLWGSTTVDPTFNKIAGSAAQGLFVIGSPSPAELTSAQSMVTAFTAKFGRPPGVYDTFAYDAMETMLRAMKAAGSTNPSAIITALHNTDFAGASGKVQFTASGDRTFIPFQASVYNGQLSLVPYQP